MHAALKSGQRDEIVNMMADGVGYREILDWLQVECGVKSSAAALTNFYKKVVAPILDERRAYNAARAEAIVANVGAVDWDAASLELLRMGTFKMLSSPDFDPETVEKFVRLQLKGRDQDLAKAKHGEAIKSKIESGMDAMFAEIKGNPQAEKLFKQLQEVVSKA